MMPITHVTPVGGNVFADIGFPPAEAESLKICSGLMMAVQDVIDGRSFSVAEAAKHFGVSQAIIKKLIRGHIDQFNIDLLVKMLAHAGMHVEVSVRAAA